MTFYATDDQTDELRDLIARLRNALRELLDADDAMCAFLIGANAKELGETEWSRQHAERSKRRQNAIAVARTLSTQERG